MSNWKPIKDAPKDGTAILGWMGKDWIEGITWYSEGDEEGSGYWLYLSDGDSIPHGRNEPKYWMTLPDHPNA